MPSGRKLLKAGMILLGLWLIVDVIYAGFIVQRVVEVGHELKERQGELVRMWGWEEVIKVFKR